MRLTFSTFAFLSSLVLSCSTTHQESQGRAYHHSSLAPQTRPKPNQDNIQEMIEEVNDDLQSGIGPQTKPFVEEALEVAGVQSPSARFDQRGSMPLDMNDAVQSWIDVFTNKERELFQRYLQRGEAFRPMISRVLAEYGIPQELYYLALIESGFTTSATSRASAVGIWQFIRGTGKRYGLRVDHIVDERRDPETATRAAAQYLSDLFRVYQSWYLAMASYNAGESRIMGAVMRHKTRDFWTLADKRALPRETMNYIPKFIAAAVIGNNKERYGFDVHEDSTWAETKVMTLPKAAAISDIARTSGIASATLKQLNPAHIQGILGKSTQGVAIRVPERQAHLIEANIQQLAQLKTPSTPPSYASTKRGSKFVHIVRRGESLFRVARKYKTSIANIKRLNGLKSNKLLVGQKLVVRSGSKIVSKSYRVQTGDNLTLVAKKFGVPLWQLKKINGIKRSTIYPGQVLTVAKN